MKTALFQLNGTELQQFQNRENFDLSKAQLVLCFAGKDILKNSNVYKALHDQFPKADIAMCSTAGEIYHDAVQDDSIVVTALQFDKTLIKTASINIKDYDNSYNAATELVKKLPKEDLTYIMVFSDGSLVNGSELVKGLSAEAGEKVLVTGGLAGDGANFHSTLVGLNEQPETGKIVAIGFYGNNIVVTHGSQGGWEMFGLEKEITKSSANVLYEIDNQNALDLYKKYLGDDANDLPGSALLFPLSVTIPGSKKPVVRTILSIDANEKSMTFAGDVPEGSKVRFMKANFNKLKEAAATAARQTSLKWDEKPGFALLVSCVGRKLVLGPRIDEETEAVRDTFNNETLMSGFYSYGEISPFSDGGSCQLHNQTMTITSFYELS